MKAIELEKGLHALWSPIEHRFNLMGFDGIGYNVFVNSLTPGAPSPRRRVKAARRLLEEGYRVKVISPYS